MSTAEESTTYYHFFVVASVYVLKALNGIVDEPYMDEPFHVPQAQAYCRGEFDVWDPKITTPPGLYILSTILKRIFLLKCTLPVLRLTPLLTLIFLPPVLTLLLAFHKRIRAPPIFPPFANSEATILASFPVAWFFGFLYYTEVPSLLTVVGTVVAAGNQRHWLAALLGLVSCAFRQTNIVWVLYAFAAGALVQLRFQRAVSDVKVSEKPSSKGSAQLHDPLALEASIDDLLPLLRSIPRSVSTLLRTFIPYSLVLAAFAAFVIWNGGIVLGDKANHVPALHVPQLYYYFGFATALGWPVLVGGGDNALDLAREIKARMFGSRRRVLVTAAISALMAVTVHLFTVHHPFLLADNRHYTFYVWRRVFMLHPLVPYLLIPGYIACAWAWFLRVGHDQTLLQTLILPACLLPTLVPTPLLEPRYFLVPYILMRAQVKDMRTWGLVAEGAWYAAINAATMYVFLCKEREGVGRFMW
ncbi:glucosyltransferase [Punctularia strigosozonata HHB-11173 SS5]|uniref:glucosyltransferase n=1 Tax=Punctularia strigosozonata (strain HHB-11173) TaxID=741275 RepID=UPI0004418118|nr:glucosyltransferase [Punctularia strigosozonata HHB-11173 SS5]EIN13671.1 glucosyltransferase [Punctularia strigosozonata HHB-11173 SS5]